MKTIKVIFNDESCNYFTKVNKNSTDEEIRNYFVGTYFNLGIFPEEDFKKCIDIEIIN